MDTQRSATIEFQIKLSNTEVEQLSALAARHGISTDELILRAINLLMHSETASEADWQALSLSTFQATWDNEEDAVYDDWRAQYGLESR